MQTDPLPVRLAYSGPVFRYESPQAGRSRQFTEFGAELLGADGLLADAELLTLALDCLAAAGLERPHIVLGHIGVVIDFLAGLNLDQRAQDWLIWSMERLRRGDPRASEIPAHLASTSSNGALDPELDHAIDVLDRNAAIELLRQAGLSFEGSSRTPEEIVEGLIEKRGRRYDRGLLDDALAFVLHLTDLSGPPEQVLDPLRELVAARGLDVQPLDELAAIVALLAQTRDPAPRVTVDLGMGRGLRYYTGMLFEIYQDDRDELQLGGGGRYDDLAQHLGARQPVAACGFSLGIERVLAASGPPVPVAPSITALVVSTDDAAAALSLAARLREVGWTTTIDARRRSAQAARRWAQRQGFAAIATTTVDGIEIERLADGARRVYDHAPAPDTLTDPPAENVT
jgi:histidyl-tRNA synthetase